MATYPTPVDFMNLKQLKKIARDRQIAYDATTTQAALVTLINA